MALLLALNLSRSLEARSGCRGLASGVLGMEGGVQAHDQDQALVSGAAATAGAGAEAGTEAAGEVASSSPPASDLLSESGHGACVSL